MSAATSAVESDIAQPELAPQGKKRVLWADQDMPVLRQVRACFEEDRPFAGLRVSACLPVTAETANLVRTLTAGGADVVLVASDPRSTQDDVAASLVHDFNVTVGAAHGEDADRYYRHVAAALEHEPHVTLDDGADLVSAMTYVALDRLDDVHPQVREWAGRVPAGDRAARFQDVIGGLEGTAAGAARVRALEKDGVLRFPVVAVNDVDTRHLFDSRYGTGQSTVDGVIRATNMLVAGKRVVVSGYGRCGKGVAGRVRGLGAQVVVTEVDPVAALEAAMDGFAVMPVAEAAAVGDLFITATGSRHALAGPHFEAMKDGAVVCNSGHFDVEIDLGALKGLTAAHTPGVRPEVDEYRLKSGRRLYVIGRGRPVNLAAGEGHPASVMDMSLATLALAAEYCVQQKGKLPKAVVPVPRATEEYVATAKLRSMGITIDAPTADPARHGSSREHGT